MQKPIETRVLFRSNERTPLGYVRVAGYVKNSRGLLKQSPRTWECYVFVYLIQGGGIHITNGITTQVGPGDLIVITPGQPHSYGPLSDRNWDEFHFAFGGPAFEFLKTQGIFNFPSIIHLEPVEYWLRRLERVVHNSAGEENSALMKVCELQHVIGEIADMSQNKDDAWLRKSKKLLTETPFARNLDWDQLARKVGMSYQTFRKRFSKATGIPPDRYRAMQLMDEICKVIQQEKLSNKEIAKRYGFSDEFHFSKRFKQLTGLSPTKFREESDLFSS
jgi:AraC-like DNA-binding protein